MHWQKDLQELCCIFNETQPQWEQTGKITTKHLPTSVYHKSILNLNLNKTCSINSFCAMINHIDESHVVLMVNFLAYRFISYLQVFYPLTISLSWWYIWPHYSCHISPMIHLPSFRSNKLWNWPRQGFNAKRQGIQLMWTAACRRMMGCDLSWPLLLLSWVPFQLMCHIFCYLFLVDTASE